jgi:hypothetical protein
MAIYILAPSTDQPLGADGGSVFQKCGNSFAIRKRAKPVMKRTAKSTAIRNRFEHVSGIWRTLSGTDQDTFIDEAPNYPRTNSLGDSYDLTGNNLQNSSNLNLIQVGLSPISSIPAPVTCLPFAPFLIDAVNQDLEVFFIINPDPVPIQFLMNVYATAPLSPGIEFVDIKKMKFITRFGQNESTISNRYTEYSAVHGPAPYVVGNIIFVAFQFIAATTGQPCGIVYGSGDVNA